MRFYAVCGIGAIANVGVASYMLRVEYELVGLEPAGIVAGTAFNYTMSSIFVWRRPV